MIEYFTNHELGWPGIASVSQSELAQRRRMLRNHRRLKLLQSVLRTLAVSGIVAGLVWATTRPIWCCTNQISIEGNQIFWAGASVAHTAFLSPLLLRIQPEATDI